MRFYFLIITFIFSSCVIYTKYIDTDDLYYNPSLIDTIQTKRIIREPKGNHIYYTPNYGWYDYGYGYGFDNVYRNYWYRPNVILIQPSTPQNEYNYGKRPSREEFRSNTRPNSRGRDRD